MFSPVLFGTVEQLRVTVVVTVVRVIDVELGVVVIEVVVLEVVKEELLSVVVDEVVGKVGTNDGRGINGNVIG